MLLAPLQEFALEIYFLIGHFVYINEPMQYLVCDEVLTESKSPVQIDGSNKGLKSISGKITVVHLIAFVALDKFVKTNFNCQFPQRFALYDFAARIGQEPLTLAGKMVINYFSNHGTQYCVAQKLQSFIVERYPTFGMC